MKELIIELVKENLKLEEQIEVLKCEFEKERSEYKHHVKDLREQFKNSQESDLIRFGNYLLSKERNDNLINKTNTDCVTHADVENWKAKKESSYFF